MLEEPTLRGPCFGSIWARVNNQHTLVNHLHGPHGVYYSTRAHRPRGTVSFGTIWQDVRGLYVSS